MASSATIMVPTTASRFAPLQIDSDSDSDPSEAVKAAGKGGAGKQRPEKSAGGKAPQGNDKKKDKRKKKKEQQQSEANELRNLAFKKIPQKSHGQPACMTLSRIASGLLGAAPASQQGWQQWKQRDEQMTSELYEADLEKALILSKLEYEKNNEKNKQQAGNSNHASSPKTRKDCAPGSAAGSAAAGGSGKEKKKKNTQAKEKKTVSLQNFQAEGNAAVSRKPEKKEASNSAAAPGQEERFFNKLEDDVNRIVQREKRRQQLNSKQDGNTPAERGPDPRAEQLKYELEKKDRQIVELKKTIGQWEVKHKEVKARNGQLLKMLQQGEMKDKAEILLQVEELLHIKEELSSQVTLLHAALEQERSKVKGLQSEQPKHQGNKRGKKSSEADL
ncbi:G kinase-anchoring protein 1 isoform X2 [Syngnathoides biaculeatus]|uniref:G kinase-anchoring protein 1 isoform X2 n=1 Tax=Syngnathoides biaculeatus TaxID=300417 RepID=UPI002ADD6D57|nr:G kinase-anchoring protein 1 isoform X2 [Syngnathoides biaculeatus]